LTIFEYKALHIVFQIGQLEGAFHGIF